MTARRARLDPKHRAPPGAPTRPKPPTRAQLQGHLVDAQVSAQHLAEQNITLRREISNLRRRLVTALSGLHSHTLTVCELAAQARDDLEAARGPALQQSAPRKSACDACGTGPFDEAIPF